MVRKSFKFCVSLKITVVSANLFPQRMSNFEAKFLNKYLTEIKSNIIF